MMTKLLPALIILLLAKIVSAQNVKAYPGNWYTGMKWNKLQLLLRSDTDIADAKVSVNYPGIRLIKQHRFSNPHYLAIDLIIDPAAKQGTAHININSQVADWHLKPKRTANGKAYAQGVNSSDFVYLLMPDRFSNGDPSNDRIPGMRDQSLNRDSIFLRHGGDLQGVINHIDYLKELGITALWMTPVLKNDMPDRTEHGYAFTDHYAVEPRLGGDTAYKRLSDELHKHGMKLVQDAVYNHVGLYHFLVQDPPSPDWLHQWFSFTKPNYKDQVHFDPYVSAADKKQMVDGWFTEQMPDLNQSNIFVANYLIQHALWCVQEFGVDAWRIDTYIYVDKEFMNKCNAALLAEYPSITMFGESWVDGTANQAYFTRNRYNTSFSSNLPGTIDFQMLFKGIQPALNQPPAGIDQLYHTLGDDFLYRNPMNNIIFLDNHDMSRIYSVLGEDLKKNKMAIQWLLTERGIPQLYYGTEVLMKGISNPDGWVRLDFPGGWAGDQKNAFTGEGMSDNEKDFLQTTRTLANFRKQSTALTRGRLMHYVPQNGLYVYFRYDDKQTVMCIMNTSQEQRQVNWNTFRERTEGFTDALDVLSGRNSDMTRDLRVEPMQMLVLELKK